MPRGSGQMILGISQILPFHLKRNIDAFLIV